MKKSIFLFFVVFIFIFSCSKEDNYFVDHKVSKPEELILKSAIDWHSLSQSQKDDQIINTAYINNGQNVHVQCKQWVQNVVLAATSGHVVVPSTKPNQYEWNDDPSGHIVGRSTMIENVGKSDIIQMYLHLANGTWTPHTAIVVSKDVNGMNWIDSNWVSTTTVGVHYVTFSNFYSWAGSRYTVYHVQ